MKKILYVTTIDLTINTFLIPHIEHLIKSGYKVDCLCNIKNKVKDSLLNIGVCAHNVNFSRNPFSIKNFKAIKEIKKIQDKYKYDIIHVHTPIASFITRLALRKNKIKMIYTCHGFHFYKKSPIINWLIYYPLERIASRWTDKIITINNEDLERAKKFRLRNNGNVCLMNGVGIDPNKYMVKNFNKEDYREGLGIKKDDFMILILAELNKNKNHIQIIKALGNMKDNSKIKVVCAGKGPIEAKLKKKIKKYGVENNVKFIGFREDVRELIGCCDCVALFSKREGLGKCLLEAMIAKKILISTNTRGARTIIRDKENGFLIKIGDYKETISVIENLVNDKNIANSLIKNSEKDINKYLLKNVLKQIEQYHK